MTTVSTFWDPPTSGASVTGTGYYDLYTTLMEGKGAIREHLTFAHFTEGQRRFTGVAGVK